MTQVYQTVRRLDARVWDARRLGQGTRVYLLEQAPNLHHPHWYSSHCLERITSKRLAKESARSLLLVPTLRPLRVSDLSCLDATVA